MPAANASDMVAFMSETVSGTRRSIEMQIPHPRALQSGISQQEIPTLQSLERVSCACIQMTHKQSLDLYTLFERHTFNPIQIPFVALFLCA